MNKLFAVFDQFPELFVSFSQKSDGDMKLVAERDALVEANRSEFCVKAGIDPLSLVSALPVHGADILGVDQEARGAILRNSDGLTTTHAGIFLSVTAADCLAIYWYSPSERRVVLIHAGWQGLSRGIIAKAARQFDNISDVRVAVAPSIHSCHYEVKEDVASLFEQYQYAVARVGEQLFLSLQSVAQAQLVAAGIRAEYTEVSDECTACHPERYFSYRRDKPVKVQAMMAIIGLRSL